MDDDGQKVFAALALLFHPSTKGWGFWQTPDAQHLVIETELFRAKEAGVMAAIGPLGSTRNKHMGEIWAHWEWYNFKDRANDPLDKLTDQEASDHAEKLMKIERGKYGEAKPTTSIQKAPLRDLIVQRLRERGVRYFKLRFSGAGDSGNPDECEECWRVETSTSLRNYDAGPDHQIHDILYVGPDPVTFQFASTLAWQLVSDHQCDIVNNEGGGNLTFDLTESPPKVTLDIYQNVSSTEEVCSDEEV